MVTAFVTTFLQAKMKDARTSVALHSVSSDVDGAKIVQEIAGRFDRTVAGMLTSSSEPLVTDPHLVAFMLQGVVAGVSRSLLECGNPAERFESVRRELITLGCSYLSAATPEARNAAVPTCKSPL